MHPPRLLQSPAAAASFRSVVFVKQTVYCVLMRQRHLRRWMVVTWPERPGASQQSPILLSRRVTVCVGDEDCVASGGSPVVTGCASAGGADGSRSVRASSVEGQTVATERGLLLSCWPRSVTSSTNV